MSNPEILFPNAFAWNSSNKNPIQEERQPTQPAQDATLKDGFPLVTMTPQDAGGIAPNGQDFNGILYGITTDTVHRQKGLRIQFDPNYAAKIGGYSAGSIIASNDYQRDYISLIDNNLTDPNGSGTAGRWAIYAGAGSVAIATATIAGIAKLNNTLTSTATDSALTALQGKVLNDSKVNRAGDTIAGDLAIDGVLRANELVNVGWGKSANTNRSIIFYNNFAERARIQATTANRLEFINATSYGFDKIVDCNISGNSASTTRLQTSRTINGVEFDGTANITLPTATTSRSGTVQLNNTTNSSSTTEAPTANALRDVFIKLIGVNQTWKDVTGSRSKGTTYTNNTSAPITVELTISDTGVNSGVIINVGGVDIIDVRDLYDMDTVYSFIVPVGATYRADINLNIVRKWAELS